MSEESGIYVEPIMGYRALRMVWHSRLEREDVVWAFLTVNAVLDHSEYVLDILVDIRDDPALHMTYIDESIASVPPDHAKLGRWLVVGTQGEIKDIMNMLGRLKIRQDRILTFTSQTEAFKYLRRDFSESSLFTD
jgi:hypothetical protein